MPTPGPDPSIRRWRPVPGSECLITDLGGDGPTAQRLAQMGILPGTRLRVVRLAPLGDTLEVAVEQGELLALRLDELDALGCDYLVLPLAQVGLWGPGTYRVRSLSGGHAFVARMQARGLRPGGVLRVMHPGQWPLEVRLEGEARPLILGRGEAERILVERPDAP